MGSLNKSLFNDIHLYELPLQASSSQILRILIWSICIWRGGGNRANSVCFNKNWSFS